jgi:hypothetical protein
MLGCSEVNVKDLRTYQPYHARVTRVPWARLGGRVIVIANWRRPIVVAAGSQEDFSGSREGPQGGLPPLGRSLLLGVESGRRVGWRADDGRGKEVAEQESAEP